MGQESSEVAVHVKELVLSSLVSLAIPILTLFSSSINRNNERGRMVVNQTFTIEPMLTIGSIHPVMWDDNWTVVTADGSLSAQFEHTILITQDGAEILTQC